MIKGLLSLRRNLRKYPIHEAVIGVVIFIASTIAAIYSHFPYFYSTFVIGVFLFFDALGHVVDPKISFTSDLNTVRPRFFGIIALFVIFTDFIGGQIVFSVWHYPSYRSIFNWLFLYVIIYPVGGLSVIAMYRFFDVVLKRLIRAKQLKDNLNIEKLVGKILRMGIVLFPLFVFLPLGLYFSGLIKPFLHMKLWYSIFYFVFFLEWTFSLDMLVYLYGGRPVLLDLFEGNVFLISSAVITGLAGAVLHEFINTFSYEWMYDVVNFPVTSAKFLGIPIMVLVAWIPMTVVCVEGLRLAEVVGKQNFVTNLKNILKGSDVRKQIVG